MALYLRKIILLSTAVLAFWVNVLFAGCSKTYKLEKDIRSIYQLFSGEHNQELCYYCTKDHKAVDACSTYLDKRVFEHPTSPPVKLAPIYQG